MKLLRRLCLPATVALAAVLTAAGVAAPATDFGDPAGDSGAAMDVTLIRITDDASGAISIRIETPNRPSLLTTDALNLYLDTDLNSATGDVGYDYRIRAYGGSGLGLDRYASGTWVETGAGTFSFNGGLSATVNRSDLGGTGEFRFFVLTLANGVLGDRAPDGGTGSYRIGGPTQPPADGDGDGIPDVSDACPAVVAGAYDANGNGCPGPFPLLAAAQPKSVADVFGRSVRFVSVRIANLPATGATVVVRYGSRSERIAAKGSVARSRLLVGKTLRAGATVTIRVTRPGSIGSYGRFVVRTSSPVLKQVSRLCVPASGSTTPRACGAVDRGR
jgi:hypothetical protein